MPLSFLAILFFVLFALVLLVIGLGVKYLERERKKDVRTILTTVSGEEPVPEPSLLTDEAKRDSLAGLPAFAELPVVRKVKRYIQQAGLNWSPTGLAIAMVIGAILGVILGLRVPVPVFREFAIVAMACAFGSLPYLFLMYKRRKRLAAFEEQFPEALDFLARSMRAGHAFSVSLEMLADESPDPLGLEFRQVFNEQNLGAPIEVAMRNLFYRVPLIDVSFFVSAVLLQRETGGNLAEILTKLAYVIRERFRLKGQVRAVSAHGRITALVLSVLPVVTMILLMIIAPGYLAAMAKDSDGKWLIVGAVVGQFIGYIWMKKIINIKV